jgi:hypothetical protein
VLEVETRPIANCNPIKLWNIYGTYHQPGQVALCIRDSIGIALGNAISNLCNVFLLVPGTILALLQLLERFRVDRFQSLNV